MPDLARQLQFLGTENAFAVSALANDWRAKGNRIFPFHLGDINFPPPQAMREGCARAIAAGLNGYCAGAGIPLLREELARALGEERGVEFSPEQVAVQPGGKPVIGKFLAAVMNPGEEVLYPVPGFPIYQSQIAFQSGVAVPYHYRADGAGGFALDLEGLRAAVSPKTRALIFNNYHNPTGAAASEAELDAIAEIAEAHNLWVLADDAYFNIRFDGEPARSLLTRPGMTGRTVVLFTCSKQFAMTGWRVGAAVGPVDIVAAIAKMNTNWESCTTHFAQQAIGEALRDGKADYGYVLDLLGRRRDCLVTALNAIDGLSVAAPRSAFYVYCDMAQLMRRRGLATVDALMREVLVETGVSFCTGEHFGESAETSFARFAFSGIDEEDIGEGLRAFRRYCEA